MSLEGKVALVTGASRPRGIGRAAALALAKMGANVAVADLERAMEGASSVAKEIAALGTKSLAVPMDVTDFDSVQKGFGAIKSGLGPVSILVNNAALMGHHVTIAKTTIEEWDREVKICLNGSFYCLKEAWTDMCANKWGRVINLTSVAGVLGGYGQSSYSAAKSGLIGLAKSAALEGARFNITANCVLVGISATDNHFQLPEESRKKIEARTAPKRAATPEEVADAIAYLASDSGAYMTGAIMNLLGGLDLFIM